MRWIRISLQALILNTARHVMPHLCGLIDGWVALNL